jgi:hypothetical protein
MSIESLICHPGVAGDLDVADTLDELVVIVDDLVYLECFEEIEAAHKVAKQMSLAQRSDVSTEYADQMSTAGEEFNRMGCEDLRALLARLVNHFVDTNEVSSAGSLFRLSDYFLDRLTGGKFRLAGQINLAENHERIAGETLANLGGKLALGVGVSESADQLAKHLNKLSPRDSAESAWYFPALEVTGAEAYYSPALTNREDPTYRSDIFVLDGPDGRAFVERDAGTWVVTKINRG